VTLRLELAAVAAGGVVGTGLRLAIDGAVTPGPDGFPLSTLIINAAGAFLLGAVVARVWTAAPSWLRAFLGVGLLGSFTTFSAFAVSLVTLAADGAWMPALGYLVLTLVLGLGAAWLGLALGRPTPLDPDYRE
jgi:fluoride exporter